MPLHIFFKKSRDGDVFKSHRNLNAGSCGVYIDCINNLASVLLGKYVVVFIRDFSYIHLIKSVKSGLFNKVNYQYFAIILAEFVTNAICFVQFSHIYDVRFLEIIGAYQCFRRS